MLHLQPYSRNRSIDGLFFPEAQLYAVPAALVLLSQLYAVPAALVLLSQLTSALIQKASLKVSQTANDNTRKTLQEHVEGHHRNEELLRKKCLSSYTRTFLKTKTI